jgi:gliding motility-associated-like protein
MKFFILLAGYCTSLLIPVSDGMPDAKYTVPNHSCELYVPNVFSPNGDALNDTFKPSSSCGFASFEMKIFSRWGQLVYNSRSAEDGWNGETGGEPAPADVYTYMISYSFEPADSLSSGKISGDLALIR